MINNVESLVSAQNRGEPFELFFFWGHKKPKDRDISETCFSQWYEAGFQDDNEVWYPTAEHYMMAEKARLFEDSRALEQILKAPAPGKAKSLGRRVKGFDEDVWKSHQFDIVVRGNLFKFRQNKHARKFLLATEDLVIVEASPTDTIWGIGLSKTDARAKNPSTWRGLNLLGFALMDVRAQLARDA